MVLVSSVCDSVPTNCLIKDKKMAENEIVTIDTKKLESDLVEMDHKRDELTFMATEAKKLKIKGIYDKEGYALVKSTKNDLMHTRTDVAKMGKALRDGAVKIQKFVLNREKELISIIEPAEKLLKDQLEDIDNEKIKQERMESLPARMEKLAKLGIEKDGEYILEMNDTEFDTYLNDLKSELLEKQEEALRIEKEKLEADKLKLEEEKQSAAKKAQEAIDEAKRAKEQEKAIEEATARAKEQARKEMEDKAKRDAEAKAKAEKEQEAELAKKSKYQEFLKSNGVTEETKDLFYIKNTGTSVILYRLIGELEL